MACVPAAASYVPHQRATAGVGGGAVMAGERCTAAHEVLEAVAGHYENPAGEMCAAHDVQEAVARHHDHAVGPNQCCSAVVQAVAAPVAAVWSVVRRFDKPQVYKHFVKSCSVIVGDGDVGTLREVRVVSGLPAATSTERLEILDDESHVLSFRVVGGEHRLANYCSVTTLHPVVGGSAGGGCTLVVESYVVDVPPGNTTEETRVFVDTIVKCNLQSLARIAEGLVRQGSAVAGIEAGVRRANP
ncbi:unnamed protein product [Musa acuminata var. zebrina]